MSSKDATPASDAANKADTAAADTKPLLNAREEDLFKIAMIHCLKSGPPDIDIQKFTAKGGFNTVKTASNTWGKIKAKLPKPEVAEGDDGDATPKKVKATPTPRKRAAKKGDAEDDDGVAGEGDSSPKKKPRKSPVKKTPAKKGVKKEDADEEGGNNIKAEDAEEE
ncbi:hypothetical protein LTR37_006132 [Vermiconidia calcicola]|uniref:Uncharacterized protein n=1 Tax=Vermiconidia calcicola TaxID=1690605 RepID=A0ACC3NHA2_9PEZI|nr:hypothetical protein LTR37_006132 [Vermiconidia calcicola]